MCPHIRTYKQRIFMPIFHLSEQPNGTTMTSATTSDKWLNFLTEKGYSVDGSQSMISSADANNTQPALQLIPLTHFSAYTINGPDSEKFLQGQTSCNISKLSKNWSLLGANCNPKGSVINFFRLMKIDNEQLLMRFPTTISAGAAANFKKYIVFSKAEFTNADADYIGLGLQGESAEALLKKITDSIPAEWNEQVIVDGTLIVRQRGTLPRFEIWTPSDKAQALWSELSTKATLASTDDWLLADIAAGIAIIDESTQEEFIPQMLNLHMIGAIDFHKGCYTGQEIITRLQYRGKLNKCLFRAEVTTTDAPNVGDTVWSPQRQQAGEVIAVVGKGNNTYETQIVIHIKTAEDQLRLNDEDGAELTLIALPYEIDPEWRPEEKKLS